MSDSARQTTRGIPFIVSGPSGAGKTTLYRLALERIPRVVHSVSYTTRPPRAGESDGVDYHFVSEETFSEMAARGGFIEHALIHGHRYGTGRADLERLLSSGSHVILEIDVQGAASLRGLLEGAVYVFIAPPSIEACRSRLSARGKDSAEVIETRVRAAMEEISHAPEYDYIVLNDDLERAYGTFSSIIRAEEARTCRVRAFVEELFPFITGKAGRPPV